MEGISRFCDENPVLWVDFSGLGSLAAQVQSATEWSAAGAISFAAGIALPIPIVEVFSAATPGRLSVDMDRQQVVSEVLSHARSGNPASLNFVTSVDCSPVTRDTWQKECQAADLATGEFVLTKATHSLSSLPPTELARFRDWISHLPRPATIACSTDSVAAACLHVLDSLGIGVPDMVSLVSCESSELGTQITPGITGAVGDFRSIGYEAAEMLSEAISGDVTRTHRVVGGATLAVRGSTDRLALLPDDIRVAQDFIQQRACDGITVKDVMGTQSVSRVTFERRFKEHTGQTPGAEIRRIRLEQAKKLLERTARSVTEIAGKCGFEGSSRFSLFFRKRTGMSPSEYRKRNR